MALVRYFGFSLPAGNSEQNGASIPGHCEQHSTVSSIASKLATRKNH